MAELNLFDGITLHQKPLHDQVSLYGELERGNVGSFDLKIHQKGGSVNHEHGWQKCAVRQVLASIEGTGIPSFADRIDEVVEYVSDQCAAERRDGHCFGEVLSSNYRFLSRFYRTATLKDTLRLLEHRPGHVGLLRLAGELRTWIEIDREIDRVFQCADGIVNHPGIRCKKDPKLNPSCSLAAHCHEREVSDPYIAGELRKIANPSAATLRDRPHEVLAYRLYTSEIGRQIEAATRGVVRGRLATEVGVFRAPDGSLCSVMPRIINIPESPGLPPQIVWEAALDPDGGVIRRIATNDLASSSPWFFPIIKAKRGVLLRHPLGTEIPPDGWLTIGPNSPIPEALPWSGESGAGKPPSPPPEEPEPAKPEPALDLLEPLRAELKSRFDPNAPPGKRWRSIGSHKVLAAIKGIRGVPMP